MAYDQQPSENEAWDSFTPEVQSELLSDDADAWRAIVGILMLIVTFGVSFGALVVFLISRSYR